LHLEPSGRWRVRVSDPVVERAVECTGRSCTRAITEAVTATEHLLILHTIDRVRNARGRADLERQ
jgi:hypothetical protein